MLDRRAFLRVAGGVVAGFSCGGVAASVPEILPLDVPSSDNAFDPADYQVTRWAPRAFLCPA